MRTQHQLQTHSGFFDFPLPTSLARSWPPFSAHDLWIAALQQQQLKPGVVRSMQPGAEQPPSCVPVHFVKTGLGRLGSPCSARGGLSSPPASAPIRRLSS